MAIHVQRHDNVSKQALLLDGVHIDPLKWGRGCGFNRFVHEGMNGISNVKVHLKTCSGNVKIEILTIKDCNVHLELLCHIFLIKFVFFNI